MHIQFDRRIQPSIDFLDRKAVEELHFAALKILERTGVVVHLDEVVELLRSAGCWVTDDNRVRIPPHLVEDAVRTTPPTVNVYNRNGEPALCLEDRKSYWGTGSDTPFIFDPFTDERRQTCLDDVRKVAILVDALDNFDFLMCMGVAHELPPTVADKHHFAEMVCHTCKPLVFTASSLPNLADIYQMAGEVAGGEQALRQRPFVIHYAEPIAPLIHPGDSLEKLLFCVRHDIPVIYTSATTAAQNGPATLAGSLALSVARILSGLVIGQLVRPGAKMIVTMHGSSMDPRSAIHTYASPEHVICQAAAKNMAEYYRLPTFGRAGTTESKLPDGQAAFEAGYEILMQALCGENLIHDVGYLESGLTASWDAVVMCNEFIGAAKRVAAGFTLSEDTLALDLIDRVGPQGHFMAESHTAENFRKEFWMPQLFDRGFIDAWRAEGSTTLLQRTRKKIEAILTDHKPEPLDPGLSERLCELAAKDHTK
jgi:trimethylamine--corrinoid protein Co-methyltransferase